MSVADPDRAKTWFRLFRTRGIGPKSLFMIAEQLETYQLQSENRSLNQKESSEVPGWAQIVDDQIRVEDDERISAEYEKLEEAGINIIYPGHPDAPSPPLEVSPILFIKGQRKLLTSDGVAIVGSRNVSDKGIQVAKKVAAELAGEGVNVVSGYAKGVDSAAHLGALESEGTTTMALPYGINELRRKREFRDFNWERDVLAISQFSPETKWLARNAMARNKLICALSKAVVVIESGAERDGKGKMSGTFDTGKTAIKMKCPLFVADPEYFNEPPKGNADLIELGGRKLDPSHGARDVVSHLEKKKSMKSCDTTINPNHEMYVQTDFLSDPHVSTENNTIA